MELDCCGMGLTLSCKVQKQPILTSMSVSRFVGSETRIQIYPCIIPLAQELSFLFFYSLKYNKGEIWKNERKKIFYLFFFWMCTYISTHSWSICLLVKSFSLIYVAEYMFSSDTSSYCRKPCIQTLLIR